MLNRIQLREVLAWITLILAFILLSFTVSFAQTKSVNVDSNNGKVHIVIDAKNEGNSVHIDTSFTLSDDMDLSQIVEELKSAADIIVADKKDVRVKVKREKANAYAGHKLSQDHDSLVWSKEEKEKFRKELEESMERLREQLKELDLSLNKFEGSAEFLRDFDFDFNFEMPDPDSKNFNSYSFAFGSVDDEIDSLESEDRIVIIGKKGEKPPVFEKSVTTKNGREVFIFKRSIPEEKAMNEEKEAELANVKNVSIYPNPASDYLTLKFTATKESNINIEIVDTNGKKIYTENLTNFEGNYKKNINLSGKSKGKYILKILQGKNSLTRTIILN